MSVQVAVLIAKSQRQAETRHSGGEETAAVGKAAEVTG